MLMAKRRREGEQIEKEKREEKAGQRRHIYPDCAKQVNRVESKSIGITFHK